MKDRKPHEWHDSMLNLKVCHNHNVTDGRTDSTILVTVLWQLTCGKNEVPMRLWVKVLFIYFYPRDAMLARVIGIATCPSVCLSCPSVTRQYCVKTKKVSGMICSPSGSPKSLVFWRQISSPNSKGVPRTEALNKGRSEKFSDFLALSIYIAKTVADTAKVTISH